MSPKVNDITQEPFIRYHEKKRADTITVKLNSSERELIQKAKVILEQAKDGTTLKQLAKIGYKSLTTPFNRELLGLLFKNKRNNKRMGIPETEFKIDKSKA